MTREAMDPELTDLVDVDLYEVLHVRRTASAAQIRTAVRERTEETRLERDPNEDRLNLITRAARILMDPERRQQYDREHSWRASTLHPDRPEPGTEPPKRRFFQRRPSGI